MEIQSEDGLSLSTQFLKPGKHFVFSTLGQISVTATAFFCFFFKKKKNLMKTFFTQIILNCWSKRSRLCEGSKIDMMPGFSFPRVPEALVERELPTRTFLKRKQQDRTRSQRHRAVFLLSQSVAECACRLAPFIACPGNYSLG